MKAITAVKRAAADRYPEASIRIGFPKLLPDVMAPGRQGFEKEAAARKAVPGLRHHL
ncbi:hypothetical protein [Microvirga pudoricolor]|uniref:hypothetical protein n=1 Tax=Microvirga pudoricolor TaxID=2778729 RepID=UPI0019506224|nr:hypothetical protein [Microvirga pudoricolor]MBM6592662.1 hypothetical protein [Microvirga pudoricolor]